MSAQSKRIIKARTKAGLTQEALAIRLKVTRAACSHWEQGISSPKAKHLVNLCLILKVNHEWLTLGRGEMYAKALGTGGLSGHKASDLTAAEKREEYKARWSKADIEAEKFSKMFLALTKSDKKVIMDVLTALSSNKPK